MPTWGLIVTAAAAGLLAGVVLGFGFAAWLIGMDNPRHRAPATPPPRGRGTG